MIYDFHVHTKFSEDSDADMQDYISRAGEKGVSMLCFTDHVDYNPLDYGYQYYDLEGYFKEFDKVSKSLNGDVEVMSGIEFSEPHLYKEELAKFREYPYDFIIGSIHFVHDMFPSREVREKYSVEEYFSLYWQEVLRMVKCGGFDCLGHIDFPKRYYGKAVYDREVLCEIFSTMLHNNIVLEVNTSSIRKGMASSMPDEGLLKIYKDCGGRFVTIGSDAHAAHELGADYDYAEGIIRKLELQRVFYKKRKLILVEEV